VFENFSAARVSKVEVVVFLGEFKEDFLDRVPVGVCNTLPLIIFGNKMILGIAFAASAHRDFCDILEGEFKVVVVSFSGELLAIDSGFDTAFEVVG